MKTLIVADYEITTGRIGGAYIEAKLGKMRKPRKWLIQAATNGDIIFQAEGAIGIMRGERALLTTQGGYFPHLAIAKATKLPPGFPEALRAAAEITAAKVTVI